MAKQTTPFPLALPAPDPALPRYRWLYEQLRTAILDGRLKPQSRLPATRDLARQFGLSRGTVLLAYETLESEGFLFGKVGAGTYVRRLGPGEAQPSAEPGRTAPRVPPRLSGYARRLHPFPSLPAPPARAFRANQPDFDAFPAELWSRVLSSRLRRGPQCFLGRGEALGDLPLREAIADYLTTMRGVRCTAERVVVVAGSQEGIGLTARILLDPGDPVWMEDPGYIGATYVFQALGARLLWAPVDERGLDVERARRELGPARLAYVTPAHQYPLGHPLDLDRRLALLRWVEETGALILEDDYDGEYRFAGPPLSALQGLDQAGTVIYCGTFSKVLTPALRLGYLVVPESLVDTFAAARSLSAQAPVFEQAALCDFITQGHFGRHIRRMRELYAERAGVLAEAARSHLAGLLDLGRTDAGLQTVGWLAPGLDAAAAVAAAAARGVETMSIADFTVERTVAPALQLGFAAVPPPEIRRGVEDLARALEGLARTQAECFFTQST